RPAPARGRGAADGGRARAAAGAGQPGAAHVGPAHRCHLPLPRTLMSTPEDATPRHEEDPKRSLAVALRYEKERKTPVVVAKGSGLIAEEILRRAKEAGVFVHSSKELIDLLMQVDLDARIPPSLYVAVAEILAWVVKQDEEAARKKGLLP